MPTLTNPCDFDLFCHALGAIVPLDSTVEVSDEVAEAMAANSVFIVGADPAEPATAAPAETPDETLATAEVPAPAEVTSP